jgi:hypothetical protein
VTEEMVGAVRFRNKKEVELAPMADRTNNLAFKSPEKDDEYSNEK